MTPQVCNGATLACSFGSGTSTLTAVPKGALCNGTIPMANILDFQAQSNIPPFGNCVSPLSPPDPLPDPPKPCNPVFPSPWSAVAPWFILYGAPTLLQSATLVCQYAGIVTITDPGQQTTVVAP